MRYSAACITVLTACVTFHAQPLPSPVSRPVTGADGFRAGFARVDITPPPGVGMAGGGPEGFRSTGYRTRLYAGALLLEDGSGERIALVVTDLPHVSANLHRLVAARLIDSLGIGADRLIISATHTHSGPSHFYGERQYNEISSRVAGYDPRVTELLVSGITQAVKQAAAARRPALVAWGRTPISGAIWNRSLGAHCRNPEVKALRPCSTGDSTAAVDSTLFMLRLDEVDSVGDTIPLGSYSVFALHGTAIPSLNTLLDGDAHVRIVQRIAAHADRIAGRPTVHLLANGAEGDAAPLVTREECDPPRVGFFDPVPAPRGPGELVDFIEPKSSSVQRCTSHAMREADRLATVVADQANAYYDELKSHLHDAKAIRRAFRTEWLPGRDGLCGNAEAGSSTAAGAEGLVTRVRGWRWLFFPLIRLGLEEGNSAVDERNRGCQGPKRTLLGPIQALAVVGEHGLPETAQLTVVRIDSLVLAAVPAEVTTVAGHRMLDSLAAAVKAAGGEVGEPVLIGLANGFLQYVTTREEYDSQAYEGGSVLYGPGTAVFLQRRLSELGRQLSLTGASPMVEVAPITAYPGGPKEIMAARRAEDTIAIKAPVRVRCQGKTLIAEWLDLPPGSLFPRQSGLIRVEHKDAAGEWPAVAADGDGRLEVTPVRARGRGRFEWRMELPDVSPADSFRVVRLTDSVSSERRSDPASCSQAALR